MSPCESRDPSSRARCVKMAGRIGNHGGHDPATGAWKFWQT